MAVVLVAALQAKVGGVPAHVAFIPDGNGRWAERRGLPRSAGHTAGADTAVRMARAAFEAGCQTVTLFALSTENSSRRSPEEVDHIARLVATVAAREAQALAKLGVHVHVMGWPPADEGRARLATAVAAVKASLPADQRAERTLCVALNYGGRADVVQACRRIAARVAAGSLDRDAVDEATVSAHLATALHDDTEVLSTLPPGSTVPEIDLVIRSGGQRRLSNFALWQAAYAELWFVDTEWPDFGLEELREALDAFGETQRRFGGLEATHASTGTKAPSRPAASDMEQPTGAGAGAGPTAS